MTIPLSAYDAVRTVWPPDSPWLWIAVVAAIFIVAAVGQAIAARL